MAPGSWPAVGRPGRGSSADGHFFEPTILDHVAPGSRVAQEEVFGPLLSVIRVSGYEMAMSVARGVPYGLSSSIYTTDTNTAFRAMRDFDSGIVYVNAGTIGAETHLPFGGTKATGNGHREAGHAALDTYTEWKAIYVDYSGRLQRAQIDNQPDGVGPTGEPRSLFGDGQGLRRHEAEDGPRAPEEPQVLRPDDEAVSRFEQAQEGGLLHARRGAGLPCRHRHGRRRRHR